MKAILGTGDLLTLRNVGRASVVAMMAGSDFIKTSTGKEAVNATLPVSLVMVRAIREYAERTGMAVGYKPAGGIKTAKQAMEWLALMKDELGRPWLEPSLFRFGASSMLADIERQLEHHVTGRYSATYRHPIARLERKATEGRMRHPEIRTKLLFSVAVVLFILFLAGESDAGQRFLRQPSENPTVYEEQHGSARIIAVRILRGTKRGASDA